MTENPVHFGTDGWRAIIAETFTFENVMACTQAIADHFAQTYGKARPMVVGYDTRFLSDEFALAVARVLAGNGFRVQLADRPAPTPALSYRIIETQACGGVIVTSSHNPFRWNGIKVKPHYGGSASPEIVEDIEARVPAILSSAGAVKLAPATSDQIERFDPVPGYVATLSAKVDIQRIKSAGLRVAIDPMYGAGGGLFDQLISGGKTSVTEIHNDRNPAFPGIRAPEPIESNLGEFMLLMSTQRYDIGIANDGDADRVGLVDEQGNYVDQLRAFAMLVNYMLGERKLRGAVVKSVTTTNMAAILAKHYGVELYETPVGFKHIGPLMMEKDALIGGEESGGYGFRGHLPERDGILAGLYLLDYAAATGKPTSELLQRVFDITGEHFYERIDIELEAGSNERFKATLDAAHPSEIAGRPVRSSDTTDGWRFFIDEGWLLFRLSGTEPLLRIYTEGNVEFSGETGARFRAPDRGPRMKHLLDAPETCAIDASGMFAHIEHLGPEMERAWLDSRSIALPRGDFDRIVVAAMGGSAAAGDYFAALAERKSPFPVELVRGYDLPRYVQAGALVVTLSYSGETEEALSCYAQAGERGAARVAISTGGALAARAVADGVPWHELNYDSPPRAALPHSLAALLRIGDMAGAISLCDADLFAATRAHRELVSRHIGQHVAAEANPAKQLAELLSEESPIVIFAAEHLAAAGRRAKNQFAENAKTVAIFEEIPEGTHNAIVGFERPGTAPAAIGFTAPAVHAANKRRLDVLAASLEENGGAMAGLQMRGVSRLGDLLEATAWGDYLSCYVALLRGIDPSPTPSLTRMRAAVAGEAQVTT